MKECNIKETVSDENTQCRVDLSYLFFFCLETQLESFITNKKFSQSDEETH